MKELVSATLAVGGIGWVTVEGLLSGNPFLIISGLLVSVVAFAILGCLSFSNAQLNTAGLIVAVVLTFFGVILAIMSFADGKVVLGIVKLLFFGALIGSSYLVYAREAVLFANDSHGQGHDDAH